MLKKLSFFVVMFALIMSMTCCKMETEEVTQQFTIIYDSNGHGTAPESKKVDKGYKLTAEDLPKLSAEGLTFGGWKNGERLVTVGEEVTDNITLKAEWAETETITTPIFSITDSAVDYGDTVEITCATTGAEIFYTIDGTTPTTSCTKYTAPITITAASTIKAIAIKSGMNNSAVATKEYTIKTYTVTFDANGRGTAPDAITGKHKGETITLPAALEANGYSFVNWTDGTNNFDAGATYTVNGNVTLSAVWSVWNTVNTPTFSTASGAVDYNDTVTITCATTGAEIFYTIDGTTPTASSTKYIAPITITAASTIKAIAIKSGMLPSEIISTEYTIKTYTITIDTDGHGTAPAPITGKHKGEIITLPAALQANGYSFDNWTDGTNTYEAGSIYTVTGNATIRATWTGWNTVSTPTFSVTDSAVDYNDTVAITCATTGADIFYTTNGTTPTASSTKYTAPILITAASTIKAIAIKSGMNNSAVATKEYTIKTYTVTFDANGHGTAPSPITGKRKGETVTIPAALTENGWSFTKWNDGTTDYTPGATYTVNGNVTIKAIWTEWETVSTPTFSVTDSAVDYNDTVAITCATTGADIFYTTDGTTPTASSTKYTAPITITAASTIKAIAIKSGMNNSAVATKEYTIKTYTITFDANGHGTAPSPMTGYKTQQITLPQAITASGWSFNNWSDGTNTYAAGSTYTVTGNVTISAVWTDVAPSNVTNLTATCTASGTVKLTWTNPTDDDFAKVVITYGTSGSETVLKNASTNNEKIITGLTNETEYTFTVKAYDDAGNASSGVSVNTTPVSFGGLQGTPTGGQTQGTVIKESWMDSTSGNIKINGTAIAKTSEVVAVPAGTVAAVTIPNDTSWSTYCSGSYSYYKGVFLSGRKVKLDPFVMSQYQVTQKLYMEVMGLTAEQNPSEFKNNPDDGETQENRPVDNITWFQACVFCNELTKKTFGEDQCVYYSNEECTALYTKENANSEDTVYAAYDTSTKKWTKKGYRLPTEAEWEFAARGGDPNALDGENKSIWSYAYAGVQTSRQPTGFTSGNTDTPDTPLNDYAWYPANGNGKTHEVGKKRPNTLDLYDMSGNVLEWCYDWYSDSATSDDAAYTTDGNVVNPLGSSSGSCRVLRGGCYNDVAYYSAVSCRNGINYPSESRYYFGFRLVRSTQ